MAVEMIGWIAPRVSSELIPPVGPPFNTDVIAKTARIHDEAGFDRVLIGYFSNAPDGFLIGAHAATVTSRLKFLLAHRPGFVAPTVAARKLATLDHLTGGRTAVHLIAGGNNADQARDGDFTDHDMRYRRIREYVTLLPAHVDGNLAFRSRGRVLPGRWCLCRHPLSTGAAHPHLWRWGVASRYRGPSTVRRCIHAVGRATQCDRGLYG
jgi:alkanesulfonate monooxygenase